MYVVMYCTVHMYLYRKPFPPLPKNPFMICTLKTQTHTHTHKRKEKKGNEGRARGNKLSYPVVVVMGLVRHDIYYSTAQLIDDKNFNLHTGTRRHTHNTHTHTHARLHPTMHAYICMYITIFQIKYILRSILRTYTLPNFIFIFIFLYFICIFFVIYIYFFKGEEGGREVYDR